MFKIWGFRFMINTTKFLLLISVFFLTLTVAFAQDKMQDIVYLKNGTTIKCIILEQNAGQNIKVKTADGTIAVYKNSEIDKIEKIQDEPVFTNSNSSIKITEGSSHKHNWRLISDFSALFPNKDIYSVGINILNIHLVRLINDSRISFGIELPFFIINQNKYYSYESESVEFPYITLLGSYSYYLNGNYKSAFYFGAELGYNIVYNEETRHSLIDLPGIGAGVKVGYYIKAFGSIFGGFNVVGDAMNYFKIGVSYDWTK
jgi:hypothetical protein